ncbi:MAG TPA: DEAD/DEAH box helicase [Chitinispirillaceae bacterium]|nr:DEAD/DEAH box helicase [Chitinispirillaceae bacterium]
MMESQRKTERERRDELLKVYNNLPSDHKLLLQVLAVLGKAINMDINSVFYEINRVISPNIVNQNIKKSINLHLINNTYNGQFALETTLLVPVIESANEDGILKKIETTVTAFKQERFRFFENDTSGLTIASMVLQKYTPNIYNSNPLDENDFDNLYILYNSPFNKKYLSYLPIEAQILILKSILKAAQATFEPAPEAFEYTRSLIKSNRDCDSVLLINAGTYCLTFSKFADFDNLFDENHTCPVEVAGIAKFLRGDDQSAATCFNEALKFYRKALHRNSFFFKGPARTFYLLSLLRNSTDENRSLLWKIIQKEMKQNTYRDNIYIYTLSFLFDENGFFLNGQLKPVELIPKGTSDCIQVFIRAAVLCWRNAKIENAEIQSFIDIFYFLKKNGVTWFASEIAKSLFRMTKDLSWQQQADALYPGWGCVSFFDSIVVEEQWERALTSLSSLTSTATITQTNASRICWRISISDYDYDHYTLECIEQKMLKNGNWSTGKRINPQNLSEKNDLILSEQDNKVIRILLTDPYSYESHVAAIAALVGHPDVFSSIPPYDPIEICSAQPELRLKKKGSKAYHIQLHPQFTSDDDGNVYINRESPERLVVYQMQPEHKQISAIISEKGLIVPETGKERLLSAIAALSPKIKIISELDDTTIALQTVESDSKPVLRLSGDRNALSLEAVVCPVKGGRTFQPGHGNDSIFEYIDGKQYQTQRDLPRERDLFVNFLQNCPTLNQYLGPETFLASVTTPLDCLEILSECKACEPDVSLLWLDSKPIRVSRPYSSSSMSLKIMDAASWFELQGGLTIDENTTISFSRLIELIDSSDGRFVPLNDGTFLTLSKEFKKQLEKLRTFTTQNGKNRRIHPLATLALGDIENKLDNVTTSAAWKKQIASMGKIQKTQFQVPATFQGELRDYQTDGFIWLSRLAAMRAGACLADDMGLGKTIQAITLMLQRAADGPALVIAPTSVCKNWQDELLRFAPTLTTELFSESNRAQCVKDASKGSVVICSYGLLNTSSEILCSIEWSSIVIDEAQAIKNMATQRSKAVMELKGRFRMVTTGTPVENHLGELWNIFRFINPGFLGTIEEFNRRFAGPIQQHQDHEIRQQLKTLISPFILRRLKSQVLDELPPKTESVIYVDPSKEEVALYESLRRKALEDLSSGESKGNHIRILAHIMKLRRACCHPSLVIPDAGFQGSKLEVFAECLNEILDNNHRVLVFSQFTDHLDIVRNHCDTQKITYQYLDGSTPAPERARRIKAFQQGEGSVFLMSLKAGGVGVNLTAADYVILLDPWWNPAVEDQATARAHRMGQERPVTIYRLITRGTIEEKIIDLHKHKRDLAESLLEGGDISGKMSAEELMKLIQESVI